MTPKRRQDATVTRRGHNDGTIYERKNWSGVIIGYQAQVTVPGGRRTQTFKTELEARRWIRKIQAESAAGRVAAKRPPTLGEYLDKTWLATIKEAASSRTLASYTLNVRRLPARIRSIRLDELRPAHFQDVYQELTKSGKAPRTVRQVHRTMHKAMNDALRLDLVNRNPTEGVTLPRIVHREPTWYTAEQLALLLEATADDRFHALWAVLGTLGLRLGEALGLKWSDIDWQRNTLTVRRSLQRDRFGAGLILKETKTKQSRRTLTLTTAARQALQAHRDRQDFERKKVRYWEPPTSCFARRMGHRLTSNACQHACLPRYRIHELRHNWASIQLMGGVPVERLAAMDGWSSVTMLYDVYGHIIPADFRDGASVMDSALGHHHAEN